MLNVADLPDDVDVVKAMIAEREGVVARYVADLERADKDLRSRDLLIEKLQHQLEGQLRHRFGASSESLDQLQLMLEDLELSRSATVPTVEATPEPKQKPVRKPPPDHLPRTRQVLHHQVYVRTVAAT